MATTETHRNGNSRERGLSETLWQLPRSRWLRRKILLLPIFESLIDGADLPAGAEELFVQQSSILLKSLKKICTGKSHEIFATAAGVLEDELQFLSSLCDVSKATPLSQLAVNAYVDYADQLTKSQASTSCEVHSLMAVALHVRLNLWVSYVLLQTSTEASPEVGKATTVGRWLEFCSTHYEKLSLQIDQAFDALVTDSRLSSAELNTVSDAYLQLAQHEHQVYSQIVSCSQPDPVKNDVAKTLLQMAKIIPPRVLIIAGSDSGGGAGLQADLKSCTVQGAFATTAVTAVTAQNTHGVQGIFPIPIDFLKKQVDSVLSDIGTDVVKTGMLATSEIVKAVAACLKASQPFGSCLVVDPVMVSTSGHTLLEDDAIQSLKDELFPCATLITPNLPEARLLLGVKDIESVAAMETAARQLAAMGPRWVLVKGGHLPGSDQEATDILCNGETGECIQFKSKLVANTNHTHGTGCTLASSIAAHLARGLQVPQAVQEAKDFVSGAIANSAHLALGNGTQGPMNHSWPYFSW